MEKTNPYFTASAASIAYFIIFIILKLSFENKKLDIKGAVIGACIFWIVIFLVHQYLNRKSDN